MEVVNDEEELGWKGSTTGDGRHGGEGGGREERDDVAMALFVQGVCPNQLPRTGQVHHARTTSTKSESRLLPIARVAERVRQLGGNLHVDVVGVTLDLRRQYSQQYSELVMAMANSPHAERNGRKSGRYIFQAALLFLRDFLRTSDAMAEKKSKSTQAQREASARYRQRNQTELKQKARDRMARRRAQLAQMPDQHAEYKERAREACARYRERHRGHLASRQVDRRAMYVLYAFFAVRDPNCDRAFIQKHGYDAWLKRRPSHEDDETLEPEPEPEPEQAGEPEPEQAGEPTPDLSNPDVAIEADPRDPDAELNYWLDHLDPTTAPDYVPKPGERPYFRRGKRRWD
ncbi:hypothetical protein B0H12DRAFT_1069146 [Mycena haematopus]|nr:hypothetical protein B0H12DRAFT_1069146 [Mycena haematopus]